MLLLQRFYQIHLPITLRMNVKVSITKDSLLVINVSVIKRINYLTLRNNRLLVNKRNMKIVWENKTRVRILNKPKYWNSVKWLKDEGKTIEQTRKIMWKRLYDS